MQDSQVKMIMAALLVMQLLPFFLAHVIISGFQYENEDERRWVMRRSVPINIAVNFIIWLLVFLQLFRGHSGIFQLIQMQGSYQDAARLAACSVICMVLSACAAYGGMLYFFQGSWEELRLSRSTRSKVLLLASLAVVPVLLGISVSRSGMHHLIISGYCRKTVSYLDNDRTGEAEEDKGSFVIIRNNGAFACETSGLYLSEDDRNLKNLRLKNVVLAPGESSRQNFTSDESLNVKKDGGSIVFLCDSEEVILNSLVIPELKEEEAFLLSDGDWKVVKNTSALEVDEDIITVASPVFSAPGGFYDKEFELTISAEPGTKIYYTLDGSNPTSSSEEYRSPILIRSRDGEPNVYYDIENVVRDYKNKYIPSAGPRRMCMIVRAIAVDSLGNTSEIVSSSFFVKMKGDKAATVLSIITDPANLFDGEIGIYVTGTYYDRWYAASYQPEKTPTNSMMPKENYLQQGRLWERPASVELFENGTPVMQREIGIRIQGNVSRMQQRKRFSLYSRKEYSGERFFLPNIINENAQHSFVLRPTDLYVLCQNLCRERDVATIDSRRVVLFLDGEYWGQYWLLEKFDEINFSQKYQLHEANIDFFKNGETVLSAQNSANSISSFFRFISSNDFSQEEAYQELAKYLDIQSYIDMICANTYLANMDLSEFNNNLYWRAVVPENDREGDGRWRCGLLDVDLTWENRLPEYADIPNYELNPITMTRYGTPITQWTIYPKLKENPDFRRQVVLTYMDMCNTIFRYSYVQGFIEKMNITTEKIIEFFQHREEFAPAIIAEEMNLKSSPENVVFTTERENAKITLNTVVLDFQTIEQEVPETMPWEAWKAEHAEPLPPYYQWEGKYFTEYPVTVSTEEPDFLRWEVTSGGQTKTFTDRSIEVPVVEGGVEIHAVFK